MMGLPFGAVLAALSSALLVGLGVFASRLPGHIGATLGNLGSIAGLICGVTGLAIARRAERRAVE